MNGPIAQLVALTCHANGVLRGIAIPAYFPANSTCQFCDSITFHQQEFWGLHKRTVAATPDDLFLQLRDRGATGVRIIHQSQELDGIRDRMLAGLVGGGGRWTMEVLMPGQKATRWTADWGVWNQNAPERRI